MRAGSQDGQNGPPLGRWERRLSPGCWGGGAAAPHSSQVRGEPRLPRLGLEHQPTPLSVRRRPPGSEPQRAPSWHPLVPRRLLLAFLPVCPGAVVQPRPPSAELHVVAWSAAACTPTSPRVSVSGSLASLGSASRSFPASFLFRSADAESEPLQSFRAPSGE